MIVKKQELARLVDISGLGGRFRCRLQFFGEEVYAHQGKGDAKGEIYNAPPANSLSRAPKEN